MKIATKFIHAGSEPDPSTGAIMTPIYQTSTYVQEAPGKNKGYEYARSQNPTRKALEDAYALIENAKYGLAFGSGVAATDSVIKLLNPGDEVIAALPLTCENGEAILSISEKGWKVTEVADIPVKGRGGAGVGFHPFVTLRHKIQLCRYDRCGQC